jgi:hypothetical protein
LLWFNLLSWLGYGSVLTTATRCTSARRRLTLLGTHVEQKVLDVLRAAGGRYCDFYYVAAKTGFNRETVRKACRRLAELGYATYGRGLVGRDGLFAGAGYSA